MSATTQPLAGQHKSAAPFGAVALIAGVLAFGAIGIALMQGSKATAVAGAVPADVQSALLVQRMGEKASLFPAGDARLIQHQGELADRLGAYATSDPRLVQHMGELQDRAAAAVAGSIVTSDGRIFGRPRAIPVKPSVTVLPNGRIVPLYPRSNLGGPKTAAQKGLVAAVTANPLAGKIADDIVIGAATYSGKTRDALSGAVTVDRWTVLATNPYSQGLLSRTVTAPATYATGGVGYNHR